MNLKIHLLIFSLIILSCNDEEKKVFLVPENAVELISGDTIKTWKIAKRFNDGHRMNMGDCFLSYRVSYSRNSNMRDNSSENIDCGESLEANWQLITNKNGGFIKLTGDNLSELLNIDESYKYFKIKALSQNELVLQFKHKQFSNKSTIIVDHLVPENVLVEDRDFHN
ncbi:lipocalin family protein [Ulvibacter antarcticus]|uniref:Lipocalin-like protein n=1 Tax=Ulvibacter antarcticus TaxID=442714 RepID=A0A3L9YVM4_9FLAO|nr:lipocalin family protein [Ulvibacter antarcticus]RMA64801.1 lipocalin-like protein [Ulvibacter antarcticus]